MINQQKENKHLVVTSPKKEGYERQFLVNQNNSEEERCAQEAEVDARVQLSRDYTAVYVTEAACEHIKS
jgi:capsular polysaccharide biosynthesis protein